MIGWVYSTLELFGLEGFPLRLASAFAMAFIAAAFVVGVGSLINYVEIMQMQYLMRIMSRKKAMFICNYLTCIGTIVHEISHAVMAWSTGAKITEFRPLELSKSGRLGHVSFRTQGSKLKQAWQLAISSCAPTLNGLLWCYILAKVLILYDLSVPMKIFLIYLWISIFDHMSMSEADIKNYIKGMYIVFPIMVFIMFVAVHLYVARVLNGQT